MAKVSIGLRGWRFDEEDVFTDDGEFRPLSEMDPDVRERVRRLAALVAEPCHACWLIHGDGKLEECTVGSVVYGEPLSEVLLCDEHESDFTYWYREAGGSEFRGEDTLRDEFYEWFRAGNRAPEGYGRDEHVDTDPENVPEPMVQGASCDVYLPEVEAEGEDGAEDGDTEDASKDSDEEPTVEEPFADDLAREYPS
jgi:hypothetical protein